MTSIRRWTTTVLGFTFLAALGTAASAEETPQDRVAALKQWLGQSQSQLRQYQWVETTVISVKGEEKSSKEEQCYYGADGTLVKVPVSAPPPEERTQRGIRGMIVEHKKEEITDTMQEAVALVKSYVPPSAEKIQQCKDGGKLSITPLAGSSVQLSCKDYEKPGDTLSAEMDTTTNHLLGIKVDSYLQDPKDTVTLNVTIGSLPDGTGYASGITLVSKSEELQVNVTNAGYRKIGS